MSRDTTLSERFARDVFALDMAGLRHLANRVLAAALDGARVEMPPWEAPK